MSTVCLLVHSWFVHVILQKLPNRHKNNNKEVNTSKLIFSIISTSNPEGPIGISKSERRNVTKAPLCFHQIRFSISNDQPQSKLNLCYLLILG